MDPTPRRTRSRHRRFDRRRADRARLRDGLLVDALAAAGAVAWWVSGRWPVALAWAAAALLSAASAVVGHRRGEASGGVDERWRLRGLPGPGSVAVFLGGAVVFAVTLRFGMGRTGRDAAFLACSTVLVALLFAWRDARRYRAFVTRSRTHQDHLTG